MNISGAIIVKTYLRIERFKNPGFFFKTLLHFRDGQLGTRSSGPLTFSLFGQRYNFYLHDKIERKFNFKHCVTHLDDLVVEFKRRFEDVEFMRYQINVFNNPVADAIEKRVASLELEPSEL